MALHHLKESRVALSAERKMMTQGGIAPRLLRRRSRITPCHRHYAPFMLHQIFSLFMYRRHMQPSSDRGSAYGWRETFSLCPRLDIERAGDGSIGHGLRFGQDLV